MALDVTGPYRYPNPDAAWLSKHVEDILEPDFPIIDAHHHIWQQPGNPYALEDLQADISSGHNIVATVFVQAHHAYRTSGPQALRCVGETETIERLSQQFPRSPGGPRLCEGIVGFADLTLGEEVRAVLDAHLLASPTRFKGVRQSVARDPHFPNGIVLRPAPPGMLADDRVRQGLKVLAQYGLSFDAMLYHSQLPELTAAARAVPDVQIVLDHFGCILGVGPYAGQELQRFQDWRQNIQQLASCPNVSIKLGGMGMIICGARFHELDTPPSSETLAKKWHPYVQTCVEAFGAERCMFESNFPVDKAMYSYAVLWNAFKRLCAGAPAAEKASLLHGTAARIYKLRLPSTPL